MRMLYKKLGPIEFTIIGKVGYFRVGKLTLAKSGRKFRFFPWGHKFATGGVVRPDRAYIVGE